MSPRLVEVAPGVLVATSRFMVTNTVVVVDGGRALVVDPGVHADELDDLGVELLGRRLDVVGGFATHAHWDHVLWHRELGDGPRWATTTTQRRAALQRIELVDEAEATTDVDDDLLGAPLVAAEGALPLHEVGWRGPDARLVAHEGHEPGHAALHLPEIGLLVAGDMGSDVEIPLLTHGVPGPDALAAHLEGLDRLAALDHVDVVVTGHGHVCDGAMWRRRIDADRAYLDAIAAGRPDDDTRLIEPWLEDADAAMRAALSKAEWRRWSSSLPATAPVAPDVRAGLAAFLGSRPGTVAAYDALPGEVDLADLLAGAGTPDPTTGLERAATVVADPLVLPRIGADGSVTWHRAEGLTEAHRYGIAQPRADAPAVDPADLDVVLVPGRCFDRHGIRLGRGGGHYDRLLPRLRPGTPVIGVTTEARIVARLPTESHDRPMTHLATESGVRPVG